MYIKIFTIGLINNQIIEKPVIYPNKIKGHRLITSKNSIVSLHRINRKDRLFKRNHNGSLSKKYKSKSIH